MMYEGGKPTSLIRISNIWTAGDKSGCVNAHGKFRVVDDTYSPTGKEVAGIHAEAVAGLWNLADAAPILINIDTRKMNEADKSWLPTLLHKNNLLSIDYDVCGSGGYSSAQNIHKLTDYSRVYSCLLIAGCLALYWRLHRPSPAGSSPAEKAEPFSKERIDPTFKERNHSPNREAFSKLDRTSALAVLGLQNNAAVTDIKLARTRLLKNLHPDVGGSNKLASIINEAADYLLS
jgi:hypothetical protein